MIGKPEVGHYLGVTGVVGRTALKRKKKETTV
jgi:hypothetical protein